MKDRLKGPAANIVLIICGRCPWLASLLGKFQHRLDAVFSTHRPTRRDERGQRGPAEGTTRCSWTKFETSSVFIYHRQIGRWCSVSTRKARYKPSTANSLSCR